MKAALWYDARWEGPHGIGRMTTELRQRIFADLGARTPAWPNSPVNPLDPLIRGLHLALRPKDLYYSPGFNPPLWARHRSIITIHDLIHLRVAGEAGPLKRLYYERIVKPSVHHCFRVLTVSEYSKRDIAAWAGVDGSGIEVIGNGVAPVFFEPVPPWQPGFRYFLYVGARKRHKNLDRLMAAFAQSRAAASVNLLLSGTPDRALLAQAERLGIGAKLKFAGPIPEQALPSFYRGAVALLFPSYFEGFGLPPLEAMAAGTPTLTSNVTSLPEVVGDAALTVDPFCIRALADGIDRIAFDDGLRRELAAAGPEQARRHSWEQVARKVKAVLEEWEARYGSKDGTA